MMKTMEYQDIITGEPQEKTLNMGGMYKRQMPRRLALLPLRYGRKCRQDLAKVEKLGGKIVMPKMEIKSVGDTAIILDTEGNAIGLWKPGMM